MKRMEIHGRAVFRGGNRVYSVNRRQAGYIITPLTDGRDRFVAVRFDDRRVFLYKVPDDIPNNLYPVRFYRKLLDRHIVIEDAPPIESRYRADVKYMRIDSVDYGYTGTVKVDPPVVRRLQRKAAPRRQETLDDVDQDILDIFEEAQRSTGKTGPMVEGFSPVAEMREYIGDHDEMREYFDD